MIHGWFRGAREVRLLALLLLACVLILAGWTAPSPGWDECANTRSNVYEVIDVLAQELLDRRDTARDWEPARPISGEIQQAHGRTALALLALLEVGRSLQEPGLSETLQRLLRASCDGIYALSLRTMLLARLPEQYHEALERDVARLLSGFSGTVNGWGYRLDPHTKRLDNSTTQFAALALRDAADAGVHIPPELWRRLEVRFLSTQRADGGWDYAGEGRPRASMSAAAVATLAIVRRKLRRHEYDRGGSRDVQALEFAIERGMTWLEEHFNPKHNFGHSGHLPYYLFAVERAAHATGRVNFKGVQWFTAAADVLARRGTRSSTPDLALTLLFLKRGLIPNAIGELDGEAELRRPLAASELTHRIAERLESDLGWIRIRDIDAWNAQLNTLPSVLFLDLFAHPSLLESPSDPAFKLLRRAINAGCTAIVSVPRGRGSARQAGETVAAAMRGTELHAIDHGDPILREPWPVRSRPPAFALTNGVRTLAIFIAGDPARALQRGGRDTDRIVDLLANSWLRAHGGVPPEPRIGAAPSFSSALATETIVHLAPAGRTLPEPGALAAFADRYAASGHNSVRAVAGVLGVTPPEDSWALAIISGTTAWEPSDREWVAIEEILKKNISLVVETTGGQGAFSSRFAEACAVHLGRSLEALEPLPAILQQDSENEVNLKDVGWTSNALKHFGPGRHAHRLERAPFEHTALLLVARFDLTHALLGRPASDVLGWQTPWADALLKRFLRRSPS